MAKHIGIVACSAEGAALCYRTICGESPEHMGEHAHPEITMHTHPLAEYMVGIRTGNWEDVAGLMVSSAEKVASCGADFAVCPDYQRHGVGKHMMECLMAYIKQHAPHEPFVGLFSTEAGMSFYRGFGFETHTEALTGMWTVLPVDNT